MRFLIRELPYEKPLAAGLLRYAQHGRQTGALEEWRLTAAADGYRFLRVDLDARDAESGHSHLYHLVLNEYGRLERLSFRFWGAEVQISGNVLAEDQVLLATREVNGSRFEDVVEFKANCGFWFPTSIGLGLLGNCVQGGLPPENGRRTTVMLSGELGEHSLQDGRAFTLRPAEVHLSFHPEEVLTIMGQNLEVKPFQIRWHDQERTLWLDDHNWPLKMMRDDGLMAVETRLIRYA